MGMKMRKIKLEDIMTFKTSVFKTSFPMSRTREQERMFLDNLGFDNIKSVDILENKRGYIMNFEMTFPLPKTKEEETIFLNNIECFGFIEYLRWLTGFKLYRKFHGDKIVLDVTQKKIAKRFGKYTSEINHLFAWGMHVGFIKKKYIKHYRRGRFILGRFVRQEKSIGNKGKFTVKFVPRWLNKKDVYERILTFGDRKKRKYVRKN